MDRDRQHDEDQLKSGTGAATGGAAAAGAQTQTRTEAQTQTQTRTEAQTQTRAGAAQEPVYGANLMTEQEQANYRKQLDNAKTDADRERIRAEHQTAIQKRARERGVAVPPVTPAQGGTQTQTQTQQTETQSREQTRTDDAAGTP